MHLAAVWQHSSNSNIKIVHNSIEHVESVWSDDVLSCLWIVFFFQTLSFRYPLRKYLGGLRSLGDRGLTQNESVPWEVMPEVFKCYVREMRCHLISGTEHLNTSGITSHETDTFHVKPIFRGHPIPKISTRLAIFWGGTWKTEFVKTIYRQERTSTEKKSDGFRKKC